MALMTIHYRSEVLHRDVPIMAYLPVDDLRGKPVRTKPFQTLYLLHGLEYDCQGWVVNTRIVRRAREKGIALIMPSGENSFYIDHEDSCNHFGEYVGKELVDITRGMFHLSHNRTDTFIGGFSMGGFGALRIGLKSPETFGSIAAVSAAIHIFETDPVVTKYHEDQWFGIRSEAIRSDKNPRVSAERIAAGREQNPALSAPSIYMTCGKQDTLLKANEKFSSFLKSRGFDVTYEEFDGIHCWDYVDERIPGILDWLPIEQ